MQFFQTASTTSSDPASDPVSKTTATEFGFRRLKELHPWDTPLVFDRLIYDIGAGNILDGKPCGIKERYFLDGCPPFLLSCYNISQLRIYILFCDLLIA
jgi:hypothetical protein